MPYKIVQTYENDQYELAACPSGWESNGILQWPIKKVKKQLKIEDSVPSPDWLLMRCIVKRKDIPNYDTAEKELQDMINPTSTETEQDQRDIQDFNELAKQAASLNDLTKHSSASVNLLTSDVQLNTDYTQSAQAVLEEISQVMHNSDIEKITSQQNMIYNNQKQLLNSQKMLLQNQIQIMKNLNNMSMAISEMSVKLDNITTPASEPAVPADRTLNETTKKSSSYAIRKFKPIQNIEELNHLEKILGDDKIRAEYMSKYSIVCGPGNAINCAYKLSDIFFSRDFMTKCSWAGGSRGEGTKISFKIYKNILNLFFDLVYRCDQSYTIAANEDFFKQILRNSLKRTLAKRQRASTKRNKKGKVFMMNINITEDGESNNNGETNEANSPDEGIHSVYLPIEDDVPNKLKEEYEFNVID